MPKKKLKNTCVIKTGQNLLWYKNRVGSMSFREILHRADEQLKRKISKYYTPKFNYNIRGFPQSNSPLKKGGFACGTPERKPNNTKIFSALGLDLVLGEDKWRKDPVTGNLWDNKSYCFDIDYKHSDNFGDVKYIWEINRLQHLQISALKGEKEFCIAELMDWIDSNPPFYGVVWASGIELALRVVSILVITTSLGETAFTEQQKHKINNCLSAHGYWLYRFPSKYSSANNHLVAEIGALYLLGTLAPYIPNALKYKEYGHDMLCQEITNQIHPDGVGAEQSVSYTKFSLEWFEICGKIAKASHEDFPATYWNRIEKCHEWLDFLTDENGNTIRIGDDDEGVVFTV